MLSILIGLLRILLVLLLVRLLARFVAGVIRGYLGAQPARPNAAASPHPEAVRLVRDPVCNTFVDPNRAFTRDVDGRLAYYCSAACRDRSSVLAAAR